MILWRQNKILICFLVLLKFMNWKGFKPFLYINIEGQISLVFLIKKKRFNKNGKDYERQATFFTYPFATHGRSRDLKKIMF